MVLMEYQMRFSSTQHCNSGAFSQIVFLSGSLGCLHGPPFDFWNGLMSLPH